ncbi:hypothetical protein Dsin_000852 [Dipteronia sinensis]|uniref:Retrotransposon gag domain-containing protein n=1 Tax=Dipteronia sinensis TaxID=43782 RepID=A0AAE0B2R0_9ROSI|nr:hypothetical protein Dsin_000852 [Dipteronia sinensis]
MKTKGRVTKSISRTCEKLAWQTAEMRANPHATLILWPDKRKCYWRKIAFRNPNYRQSGDQGFRWLDGLVGCSIRNFGELIQAFTRKFMGNIQRRKSISVISTLKQRNDEKLKDYLNRFSQEVSEVQDPNDDVAVSAFVKSLQHN